MTEEITDRDTAKRMQHFKIRATERLHASEHEPEAPQALPPGNTEFSFLDGDVATAVKTLSGIFQILLKTETNIYYTYLYMLFSEGKKHLMMLFATPPQSLEDGLDAQSYWGQMKNT